MPADISPRLASHCLRLISSSKSRICVRSLNTPTNPFCSASPVTDGERVIASHGSAGLVCYDFEGKELWRHDTGKLEHLWGTASSPIIHGDLCIQWCGPGARQYLIALNKKTGEKVWETVEGGGDLVALWVTSTDSGKGYSMGIPVLDE